MLAHHAFSGGNSNQSLSSFIPNSTKFTSKYNKLSYYSNYSSYMTPFSTNNRNTNINIKFKTNANNGSRSRRDDSDHSNHDMKSIENKLKNKKIVNKISNPNLITYNCNENSHERQLSENSMSKNNENYNETNGNNNESSANYGNKLPCVQTHPNNNSKTYLGANENSNSIEFQKKFYKSHLKNTLIKNSLYYKENESIINNSSNLRSYRESKESNRGLDIGLNKIEEDNMKLKTEESNQSPLKIDKINVLKYKKLSKFSKNKKDKYIQADDTKTTYVNKEFRSENAYIKKKFLNTFNDNKVNVYNIESPQDVNSKTKKFWNNKNTSSLHLNLNTNYKSLNRLRYTINSRDTDVSNEHVLSVFNSVTQLNKYDNNGNNGNSININVMF